MLTIRLIALAFSLTNSGCSTESVTGVASNELRAIGPELAQQTSITGFVELYPGEPVYLLSGGVEIPLAGATDLVVPHGGLQVTVTGLCLSGGTFLVESVSPRSGQRVQAIEPKKIGL